MDSIITDFMNNYTGKKHEVLKLIEKCNHHYFSIMSSEVIKNTSTQTPKRSILKVKQMVVLTKDQNKILPDIPENSEN
jgi:hypothetical protein